MLSTYAVPSLHLLTKSTYWFRSLKLRLADGAGLVAQVVARRRGEGKSRKGFANGSTQLEKIFVNVEEFHERVEGEQKRGEDEFLRVVVEQEMHPWANGQQTNVELRDVLEQGKVRATLSIRQARFALVTGQRSDDAQTLADHHSHSKHERVDPVDFASHSLDDAERRVEHPDQRPQIPFAVTRSREGKKHRSNFSCR